MAKIALLSQKLNPETLSLAQALQFHRHEVTVITSAMETVPDHLGFQVLTYFKSWSVLEALKFFPRILGQAPEVWHFVFADVNSEKPTPAHLVLSQLARALPGRVVAASFYSNLFQLSAPRAIPFVKSCDIVTTATRENLMYLKRKSWLNRFCETEVLPPILNMASEPTEIHLDSDLQHLLKAATPYLVIPSGNLPEGEWEPILDKIQLIVCGPRPNRAPQGTYFIGSHLADAQMREIFLHSQGVITAFHDFSLIELLHLHRLSSQTKTPVLANSRQVEALPGFCVHKRSGFVVNQLTQLNQLLQENAKLEIHSPLFEPVKTDLADSALNELNRLYSKIRHLKTSAIDFKRSPNP